jgi:RNA polymerase sigma-70 factor (ECF subfamily)
VTVVAVTDERELVEALRARDERAFEHLVDLHHASMLRLALSFVHNRAVAEEVVQEAWLGVLTGLDRFEARSSLRTWIYRIVANRAKTRAEREGRTIPFSALADPGEDEPAVDPERFQPSDHRWAGHWTAYPQRWHAGPEQRLLAGEARARIERAIAQLPPAQRIVVTLRDIEGCEADEVCNVLDISVTNQRVLLHRARSRLRQVLEDYFNQA